MIPGSEEWDWFGRGVYFWQGDPIRALEWAKRERRVHNLSPEPPDVAVVCAKVRLGTCLDLVDGRHRALVARAAAAWETEMHRQGQVLQQNQDKKGYRNHAVFEYIYKHLDVAIDTIRGVFDEGDELFDKAGLYKLSHIHLCVRNAACIFNLSLDTSTV
jgi:hypothetical protein